ncbi:MAG: HEAT repeat domain-containing protein [Planctomycetota bacterium]|jgi:HEAT repeat protein
MLSGRGISLVCVAALCAAGSLGAAEPGVRSIPETIKAAKRGPQLARIEAIDALAAVRDRESLRQWGVVGVLLELAQDRNPNIARPALRGALKLCGFDASLKREVMGPVARILRDGDRHNVVRVVAAKGLGELVVAGELQDRPALDALIASARASEAGSPEVVAACIRVLGGIGDPRARAVVRDGLTGGRVRDERAKREIRETALDAFADALRGPSAKEWLDPALAARLLDILGERGLPPATRVRAIEVAGLLPPLGVTVPGVEKGLLALVDEAAEPGVVVAAMRALASMGGERAAGALARACARFGVKGAGESADVRAAACEVSGEFLAKWSELAKVPARPAAELVELLVKAMADPDKNVVAGAVVALGNLYDTRYDRTRAAEALVAMLGAKGVDERTKRLVAGSLEIVTGRVFGDDVDRWEELIERDGDSLKPRS